MLKSKYFLIGGSVVGAILLVYGSAISNRLIVGDYMMEGGLLDPNYIILGVLCALPFVLGSSIRMTTSLNKHSDMILISGLLFATHFIIVHWAFVYHGVVMSDGILVRVFLTFPISACLIVVATRLGLSMDVRGSKEEHSMDEF